MLRDLESLQAGCSVKSQRAWKQVLSLGMEQTILSEFLSFRIGTYKNVQDAGSIFTPTGGLGIRIYSFRLDIAGGYDFNEGGGIGSAALAWTF